MLARTALCTALLLPTGAVGHPSYNDLLMPVMRDPTCKLNDQPTFSLFMCRGGLTLWYFTKPNHPAHPGVIKRMIENGAAGWTVREEGTSFAPNDQQAAFRAWLAQIKELDAQLEATIAREHGIAP